MEVHPAFSCYVGLIIVAEKERLGMDKKNSIRQGRSFSLWLYLLIVFALSWPFQIIAAIWGL